MLPILGNLGMSLLRRYEHLAELTDIEDNVPNLRKVIKSCNEGDPNMPVHLCNLRVSLFMRYEQLGGLAYIEDSSVAATIADVFRKKSNKC